ncbi:isocitrate lyase/phosphoenolpyruvate mutase family protein [Rhodoglobus aureus]|uniref:Isocitrate lyase/phosphoenolpyruvate mutase family protein n=1 Tax=Rhodoglobus aureus TaxID=191497 RepID=A0ABN1VH07_9MICO
MATFRDLHFEDAPLPLPNAWDVGSALALPTAGFAAVGTTSFGVAASASLPDGGGVTKAATAALVAQMCRLPVHVTADIEDGYSDDPAEVADFVAELAAMGVVGVNLEDSKDGHLVDSAVFAAKIAAVKQRNPDVFINARVDNLWFGEQATVDAVLLRAGGYADAGADGIFVPGLAAADDIRSVTVLRDGKHVPAATPYWDMQARLVAFSQEKPD